MDDDIIDLSARRALKQAASDEPSEDEELIGYQIGWSNEGRVMIVFATGDREYTAILSHEAARRFHKRVEVATLRAKRCLASQTSDKS